MMLGNYRTYFSRRLLRILTTFKVAIWQHKRYRYQKNSEKPEKIDDHHPDATMLALRKWPLGKVRSEMTKPKDDKHATSTITGGLLDEQF